MSTRVQKVTLKALHKQLPKYKVEVYPKLWGSTNSLNGSYEVDLLHTIERAPVAANRNPTFIKIQCHVI